MGLNAGKLMRLLIPTILLVATFSWWVFQENAAYRETYGGPDHYLDLQFRVNPHGYFQQSVLESQIAFTGYFVTANKEEKIAGHIIKSNGEPRYVFRTAQGEFVGQLRRRDPHCEPAMDFVVKATPPSRPTEGTMRAGFCP